MSKRKILFFSSNLNRTGAEIVLFDILHHIDKSKFEIGLVLLERGGALVDQISPDIHVFYLDTQFTLLDKLKFHAGKNIILDRLEFIQKQFSADIWYINTIQNAFLLQYKEACRVTTFLHVHEYLYNFEQLEIKDAKRMFERLDYLVACSELVYAFFAPIFPKESFIFHSGINKNLIDQSLIGFIKPESDKKVIISSGTVCYRKGVDLFLALSKEFTPSEYKFIWLGKWANNGYAEVIRRQILTGSYPTVEFIEDLSPKEYYQTMACAHAFVTCSREESMGLVAMEAIYCGIPVLATNSGGSNLIINEANGFLSQDFRPSTLAKELTNLLKNKKFDLAQMQSSLSHFDIAKECGKLEIALLSAPIQI
ncbi:glycosyltransferase family 4 protein [Aquirufa rosea]|uniref:Glycosyltransferase n=1 Tax=Aquirufa rosea TaxID=2509241 RepID=A0A4Q1C2B2_9BACT|nr:glycosyltransferase family 4 protein [Aquirufa rosea]RXK52245.1 glycosyltransferase [Aquirufa rosea]